MKEYTYKDKDKINKLIRSIRLADKTTFEEGDVTKIQLFYDENAPTSLGVIESRQGEFEFRGTQRDGKKLLILQDTPDDPYGFGSTDVCWLFMEFLEDLEDDDLFYSVLSD